jgi:hypothetical protein
MENYVINIHTEIISDISINNISNNYIINCSILELGKIEIGNLYLIIVENENKSKKEVELNTDISSICIKYLRENSPNFTHPILHYFKYNQRLCKLKKVNNIENKTYYELTINM